MNATKATPAPPASVTPSRRLDVVGIGNAIVDVIAYADDAFLDEHGMAKGAMTLIDEARAEAIYARMGSAVEASGGSAANTVAGVASLGGKPGFIGKVRDDVLGRVFRHDIAAVGAEFPTPSAPHGPATARCLILVTPDAQRTMNTFLGACVTLGPDDLDEDLIRAAQITHLEGYLYDEPLAKEAFHRAAAVAHAAGAKVSLSLSDTFCVERHRESFQQLVDRHVDVLFGNEREVCALYETDDLETAVAHLRGKADVLAVTRDARGSLVVSGNEAVTVDPEHVERVVDTTGAGDLYAAGFLFGLTRGASLATCGRLGSVAAAEIIGHVGARPHAVLKDLVAAYV